MGLGMRLNGIGNGTWEKENIEKKLIFLSLKKDNLSI
jgi:hypothetical protein